ncbi:OmpP1/FadL family transporter [Pararhizobium haloflavum]|uniref:OmpP1/FadL family transporter n=1 Tax=Pararhizobium haloflavum TaxID=2037914 RepID=UPI000C176D67|nr:OmpP1/FadL family transporter [Pararhizobium haloflavum]
MVRGVLTLSAAALLITASSQAMAGGLERGGYNIDLLFDPSRFAADATATYVVPQRDLNNAVDTDPTDGLGANGIGGGASDDVRETESYWVPRLGFKAGLTEDVDCLAGYGQPWGAHTNPGANWVGANHNIETKVESYSLELTCSYSLDAGPGQFRIIGGGFYQEVSGFKNRLVAPVPLLAPGAGTGIGGLELEGDGYGYRVGAAYEIPDIALRASLVYNSEVELDDITGSLDLRQIPGAIDPTNPFLGLSTPIFGQTTMPQSLELKLQSGIAPGWLAFGSVKWVDWSVLQNVAFCPEVTRGVAACNFNGGTDVTSLDLLYRDGWTITGGIGHQFSETLSGAVSLTWDRGTSTGIGSQTDTWTVSGGLAYSPTETVELRFGGAVGWLTSGSSGVVVRDGVTFGDDVSYDFEDDLVSAVQIGAKVRF